MKKIVSVLVLTCFILLYGVYTHFGACSAASSRSATECSTTYLLCGCDDAAENTDSMILANCNPAQNSISFLQIPRDTYFREAPYSKINSIYPSERSRERSRSESLELVRAALSEALGITIDACIGYTMQTFVRFIDEIGGVDLQLSGSFSIENSAGESVLSLKPGNNHLGGNEALMFVRARNGYTTGDLGRIDAQKIFLSAFMKKLKNDVKIVDVVKACISTSDGWTINAKIGDLFKIATKNRGRFSEISTKYANLPGSQVKSEGGSWYYGISATPANDLLTMLNFKRRGAFDPDKMFLNESSADFQNVYYAKEANIRIYDDDTLLDSNIIYR